MGEEWEREREKKGWVTEEEEWRREGEPKDGRGRERQERERLFSEEERKGKGINRWHQRVLPEEHAGEE